MMKRIVTLFGLSLVPFLVAGAASLDEQAKAAPSAADQAVIKAQTPFYPLKECLISGEAILPGEATEIVHEGRLIRLCCGMCEKQFAKDPAAMIAELDAAAIRAQKPYYALDICLVSDEELGSMGDPIDMIHDGRLARFCCEGCVKSFKKDPAKYFATIDRAMIADQKKSYTATTCPVSGEPLGDKAVDHLYGTQLVRTCCKKCAAAVDKDPDQYLAKVAVKRAPAKASKAVQKGADDES